MKRPIAQHRNLFTEERELTGTISEGYEALCIRKGSKLLEQDGRKELLDSMTNQMKESLHKVHYEKYATRTLIQLFTNDLLESYGLNSEYQFCMKHYLPYFELMLKEAYGPSWKQYNTSTLHALLLQLAEALNSSVLSEKEKVLIKKAN